MWAIHIPSTNIEYSTTYSKAKYSTVQYSTVQYSTTSIVVPNPPMAFTSSTVACSSCVKESRSASMFCEMSTSWPIRFPMPDNTSQQNRNTETGQKRRKKTWKTSSIEWQQIVRIFLPTNGFDPKTWINVNKAKIAMRVVGVLTTIRVQGDEIKLDSYRCW